jgi:energy-coupling factor transport system substrate-specific component
MDTDYVMNEMKRGRGTQFDPDALDAFFRLIDKGVINLDEIYAHKRAEIKQAEGEAQEELKRRAEEDKKIQAAEMEKEGGSDEEQRFDNGKGADV